MAAANEHNDYEGTFSSDMSIDELNSQREFDRIPWPTYIQITWMVNNRCSEPVKCKAHDLSRGGCSFIARNMVHVGATGIVLLDKGNNVPLLRCFEVRYCRYIGHMQHLFGARWIPMPANVPVKAGITDNGLCMEIQEWGR